MQQRTLYLDSPIGFPAHRLLPEFVEWAVSLFGIRRRNQADAWAGKFADTALASLSGDASWKPELLTCDNVVRGVEEAVPHALAHFNIYRNGALHQTLRATAGCCRNRVIGLTNSYPDDDWDWERSCALEQPATERLAA